MLKVTARFFGKTKLVRAEPHNMLETDEPDEILWIERGEDMYMLDNPMYKNKKVALVHRRDWLKAKVVEL